MKFTIYKITNILDGKFYIGKHKTKNLDDGYFGSGKFIQRAVKKYGREAFTKEILFVFDNEEKMNAKEAELVVLCEESYNLCLGGKGGWDPVKASIAFKGKKHTEESKRLISNASKNRKHSEETKKLLSDIQKGISRPNASLWLTNVPKSEEHKNKIRETAKLNHINNPVSEETREKMRVAKLGKKKKL